MSIGLERPAEKMREREGEGEVIFSFSWDREHYKTCHYVATSILHVGN